MLLSYISLAEYNVTCDCRRNRSRLSYWGNAQQTDWGPSCAFDPVKLGVTTDLAPGSGIEVVVAVAKDSASAEKPKKKARKAS